MARDIAVVCSLFYMVTSASSVLAADASQGETLDHEMVGKLSHCGCGSAARLYPSPAIFIDRE